MKSNIVNICGLSESYYKFYSVPARLNHDREFGTVIAETKNKLIIVDDEIIREHIYLIPKTKVDYFMEKQAYINIPENF